MAMLALYLISSILCIMSVDFVCIPFKRKMPWYSATLLIVFGVCLSVFSFSVSVLSLSTFVEGV